MIAYPAHYTYSERSQNAPFKWEVYGQTEFEEAIEDVCTIVALEKIERIRMDWKVIKDIYDIFF